MTGRRVNKQQRDAANDEQHAERFARGGALAKRNARDKMREQNFDERERANACRGGERKSQEPEL